MKRMLPAMLLALVACTSPPSPSPSPSVSGLPVSSTAPTSPSPPGLACRVPLASGDAPLSGPTGGGVAGHGGFLTLPSGTFTVDATSSGGYDHQASKWLPTSYFAISPDGTRYAYAEPAIANPGGPPMAGIVHIVDVATSIDHQAAIPGPVLVVAWTATGIYIEAIVPQSGAPPTGLSLINPATNAFDHQITSTGFWPVVGDHFAYGADIDPTDPHPPVQNGPGPAPGDRIDRLDLATGTVSYVLTLPGGRVFPEGLDSSQNPIIGANSASGFFVQLEPSNKQIFLGSSLDTPAGDPNPVKALADSTGIWFSSLSGVIWHYGPSDATAHQVAATGLGSAGLAGPCT
jgi:hypothetical protein